MVRLKGIPLFEDLDSILFQFQMVRLKDDVSWFLVMCIGFQFQMVRLKGNKKSYAFRQVHSISIPDGTIKSAIPKQAILHNTISIPDGTIKSYRIPV